MSDKKLLVKLDRELRQEFQENLLPFWTKNVQDEKNGGFIGRIDSQNNKVYDAEKGGILHARLLWSYSAAYKKFGDPALAASAHRVYNYIVTYFVDPQYGGLYWMLRHDGKVSDDRKHIYTQSFGIYGLVEYYTAFKKEEALTLALELYALIEKHAKDRKFGGYFESFTRQWRLNDDVRLSSKDKNEPKSMNTHLHILEAYSSLYKVQPSDELKECLRKLITYFSEYIINEKKTSLINFLDEDWTPRSDVISFGHDIEASWLLLEAAEVLGEEDVIKDARSSAVSLANSVLEHGVDSDYGLLNEADSNGLTDTDKDWWPQIEAVIGFLNAYEISRDTKFLKSSLNSWEFIKKYVIDRESGEWFEKVDQNGTAYKELDKVQPWKGPYHNMRGVLEVTRRVAELQKKDFSTVKAS